MTERLTRRRAAQLAIMAQLLDAERPRGIVDTVQRLGRVQMDPTAVVARTEHLVLYSRLGAFDRADLERLMWKDRKLFEYFAHICAMSDLPIYRHTMRRVRDGKSYWAGYLRRWMVQNPAFERSVLRQLARGPRKSREIVDSARVSYATSGWNADKNVGRMLDGLWATGDAAIVGREGQERIWGLARDWYPRTKAISEREAARVVVSRRLAAYGVARAKSIGSAFDVPPATWERALADLVREGKVREAEIEGVRGSFYVWTALLERRFKGRAAILSPFDRLIHDRVRSRELFDLDYVLEIYVPPAKRRWGYYVLPVLKGDRFIARFDSRADREAGVLRVLAMHAEPGSTPDDAKVVGREVRALARWLKLPNVTYERVPRGWKRALA
ncbi:MAG TPA: crosslink repair DNA glycosylase YcaQ family protein [Candidatus Acidoferrales bacterium]|nr:crosslink repair DNA glycosylase YcaQ family protein [Candidatus Acidoferrales bacterium]